MQRRRAVVVIQADQPFPEPIDDRVRADTFVALINSDKNPPVACCPDCEEPLVMTMEFRGAEFICMVCRRLFGFLSPTPKDETPELRARYDELKAQYDAERAEREANAE